MPGTVEERNWAGGCHIAVLAGFVFPFGSILGPLIVWLMKRNEMPLVDRHGKDVLNFQISFMIYHIGLIVVGVAGSVVLGMATASQHAKEPPVELLVAIVGTILCAVGLTFVNFVLAIIGAVKASNGERFRYPLAIPFFG